MTYSGFLLCFVVLPIVILVIAIRRNIHKPFWPAVLAHMILAVVYTTPWDNYLVATQVWSYNPHLVTGILFGYVPIEEYLFFVLETLLAGLWWRFLSERFSESKNFTPANAMRWIAFFTVLVIWIFFAFLLFKGGRHFTYLSITLFWALPVLLPQMLFGADILWHHRRLVSLGVLVPAVYLSAADIVALRATTWSISAAQATGILFFGILPVEEIAFFLVTTSLVVFGVTLLLSGEGRRRFSDWKSKINEGIS